MDYAFGIIWIILAFNIGYMALFALLGLFYPKESYPVRNEKLKFCVFIPAYKGDEVILHTAEETLKQKYPQDKFDVVVIADSLKKETIQTLQQMKLQVVEVHFENSTKGKSLNAALAVVGNKEYDYAVVLDIDN
ncbi:MAG: glycosyltransferase, partial [Bacteroidota bacterium]|nr:glycosyltransferase [Bacteroidota bacterium]